MKARAPTAKQRAFWGRLVELGCIISGCGNPPAIHHCETGGGGRKDHDKVLPLCFYHHQGAQGIHTLSRRVWEKIYGTERALMERAKVLLGMI